MVIKSRISPPYHEFPLKKDILIIRTPVVALWEVAEIKLKKQDLFLTISFHNHTNSLKISDKERTEDLFHGDHEFPPKDPIVQNMYA